MNKRVTFRSRGLPYLLLAPQLIITVVFFLWPAAQALKQSVMLEDAFGLTSRFVWLENFAILLSDPLYYKSVRVTAVFSILVTLLSMGFRCCWRQRPIG